MVLGLGSVLHNTQISVHIPGCLGHYFQKISRTNMVRARTGDQDSSRTEHLQSPQIELLVAAQGRRQIALALGESWRIEDDGVEMLPGTGVVAKQVEGVSLNPFNLASVQGSVAVGDLKRRS